MALGPQNPSDENEPFNMDCLAVRGSSAVTGAIQCMGRSAGRFFSGPFPGALNLSERAVNP